MSNEEQLDAFEAYLELLAVFDSFDDYVKQRDLKECE